jgi:DNA-binding transcriptional regulator YhcF (GntR family)
MASLPMLEIVTDDPIPPYEQLRRQLADLIGSRALAGGDRLPPLRQLAGDLGLAVGTVARAYRELEADGLIRSRRGGGTRVVDSPPVRSDAERERLIEEHAIGFVRQARLLAASDNDVLEAVHRALAVERSGHSASS